MNRPLSITLFSSRHDTSDGTLIEKTWPEIVRTFANFDKWRNNGEKDDWAFVAGRVEGRGKANTKSRSILTLDMDKAPDHWRDLLKSAGVAWLAYSTFTSSDEQTKLRPMMPFTRDVTPREYEFIARALQAQIGREWWDWTGVQPSRLMYWPNEGAEPPVFESGEGEPLDPDTFLVEGWNDRTQWPRGPLEKPLSESTDSELQDPRNLPGVIGAFCRVYSITDVLTDILTDTYEPTDNPNRWSFTAGSGRDGARIYDDDTQLYSEHHTDPANTGHCVNAFHLVRIHMFGSLDNNLDGDVRDLPSTDAMNAFAMDDPAVVAELKAYDDALVDEFDDESAAEPMTTGVESSPTKPAKAEPPAEGPPEGPPDIPADAPNWQRKCPNLRWMSKNLVWVDVGSRVHDLTKSASTGTGEFIEVKRTYADRTSKPPKPDDPKKKPPGPVETFKLWNMLKPVKLPSTFGRTRVHTSEYFPVEDRIFDSPTMFDAEGKPLRCINEFAMPRHERPPGDLAAIAKPFIDHITHLAVEPEEREWLTMWFAFTVQQKIHRCPAPWLISPVVGTGRGWVGEFLQKLLDDSNVGTTQMKELLGGRNSSQFNHDYLANRLVTIVNEAEKQEDVQAWQANDRLKELIIDKYLFTNAAYGKKGKTRVFTNFLIFSNSTDAIKLDPGDRRFVPIQGPSTVMPDGYYERLYTLLHDKVFIGACYHWLMDMDLSEFRWQRPPLMPTKKRLTVDGMHDLEQAVYAYVEHVNGRNGDAYGLTVSHMPKFAGLGSAQIFRLFVAYGLIDDDTYGFPSQSAVKHLAALLKRAGVRGRTSQFRIPKTKERVRAYPLDGTASADAIKAACCDFESRDFSDNEDHEI